MNQQHESDEWLMGQVRGGNRDALEKLLRRYASPLLTFVERMLNNRHRSEEIFQDVFLKVWQNRRRYKLKRPFRAWLYAIAANRCRDELRRKSPSVDALTINAATGADPSPVQTAIATETASLVEQAVGQLPSQQRTVIVLRVWNGLSFREIADVVETTESTVRSNLYRGLQAMRQQLEPRLQ